MNITANTVASKLFVAFVAAAMLFTLATPAKAATAAELQAQIDALMAQISALQGGTTSASSAAACTFTRSLTIGSEGSDVKCLQDALTPTYFNNAGGSTGYFGSVTAAAVAAWQSANGVSPAVGYFGPVSQAKFNATMTSDDSSDDSDDSSDDSDDSSDDSSSTDLSGEASLTTFEVADGEDSDDVEEGSEEVEVAEFTVEFSDGDAMITRLDVVLDGTANTTNTESDPWDIFEELSLVVDGEVVATVDASDEDEYLDEDDGSIRFSGLDVVAMEDEEVTIVLTASITSSVDDAGSATLADWDVYAGELRFEDADEVTSTETATGDLEDGDNSSVSGANAEFTIDTAGAGDDLNLESSDEDPDATTFALDEDSNVEEAIFAFDLSAEDSDGDVDLNQVQVHVYTSTTSLDTIVNDFRLDIGGDSYDAESYVGTGAGALLTFDVDGDTTVAADEVVTATLYADFENMDEAGNEGTTIIASTTPSYIDAEGEDDITVDGSEVEGETHTLRTEGLDVDLTEDTITEDENSDTTNIDDSATFRLEFSVAAFGDTLYIPFGPTTTSGMTDGVKYQIVNSNGTVITTGGGSGTTTASLDVDDSAAEETNSYKINDAGETLILEVEFDPVAAGSYRLEVIAINFATTDAVTATQTQNVSDLDIKSDLVTIQQ